MEVLSRVVEIGSALAVFLEQLFGCFYVNFFALLEVLSLLVEDFKIESDFKVFAVIDGGELLVEDFDL